jgi:hypothetical protein
MDDFIDLSVAISRPSTPLEINNRTSFEIPEGGWAPLGKSHRLNELEGENNPGSVLLGFVADTATINGVVRVLATSESSLRSRITTLFDAMSQRSYTITEVIDGESTVYTGCRPASSIECVGGVDWDILRGLHQQAVTYSIRCNPRP